MKIDPETEISKIIDERRKKDKKVKKGVDTKRERMVI